MRVDANYRFIAAYPEVNARVSRCQQALNLDMSLVVSLLAALVAKARSQGPIALAGSRPNAPSPYRPTVAAKP